MTHLLIRTVVAGSVSGYCSCGGWTGESFGTDESSRSGFNSAFKTHAGRA